MALYAWQGPGIVWPDAMLKDILAVQKTAGNIVVLMVSSAVIMITVARETEQSAAAIAVTQGIAVVATGAVTRDRRAVVKRAVPQGRHVAAARAVQVTVAGVIIAVTPAFRAVEIVVVLSVRRVPRRHRRRIAAFLGLRPAVSQIIVGWCEHVVHPVRIVVDFPTDNQIVKRDPPTVVHVSTN